MLEAIMSDVTWLLSEPYRNDIFITTDFDERWVKVRFGYSANYSLEKVLEDYKQFENVQTSHEFYGESLFLYNTWRKLRAYGAELFLNIQEEIETSTSPKLEITIHLKR